MSNFDEAMRDGVIASVGSLLDESAAVVEPPREGRLTEADLRCADCGHYHTDHSTTSYQCNHVLNPQSLCGCHRRQSDVLLANLTALRSALSAAQQDSKRLDWLDRNPFQMPMASEVKRRGRVTTNGWVNDVLGPSFPSLRDAIDAASRPPSTDGPQSSSAGAETP